MDILYNYQEIIKKEAELSYINSNGLSKQFMELEEPLQMQNITYRILEIAYNATIMRAGSLVGHLTSEVLSYESDSAHTNLVRSLVKYALDCQYGWDIAPPNYDRNEIDEAITLHDLSENETGDIPDNRNRNETKKLQQENAYYDNIIASFYPSYQFHAKRIHKLLHEMQNKSSAEGRMLYVADKISAVIMMLIYDTIGLYPKVYPGEPAVIKIEPAELAMCSKDTDGSMLLSELWTLDYLYGREIIQYDDTGFFTAILIMATLIVHEEWYRWREIQYK